MRLLPCCACLLVLASASAASDDDYEDPATQGGGRTSLGARTRLPTIEEQAARDLEPGQGRTVIAVRPGSTASQIGLEPGDVLLQLNGVPTNRRSDIRQVVRASQAGDAVTAVTAANGGIAVATGTFQPRQPWTRPPGGWMPPPEWFRPDGSRPMSEDERIAAQRQRLADEAALYRDLAADLARLRDLQTAARANEPAWRMAFACRAPEPAAPVVAATDALPISDAVVADAGPAWRFSFRTSTPGVR